MARSNKASKTNTEKADTPPTMRELFPQHYRPSESDFDGLFQNCIVAVDANVLLDFYRVQEKTREDLCNIFAGFQERFWVPYQAGLEFQRNRLKVRDEQRTLAAKVQVGLEESHAQLVALLQAHQHHAFLNAPSLLERIAALIDSIVSEIQHQIEAYPAANADDPLHERITDLVGAKIGHPYSSEKREELTRDAKTRFAAKVPPGYKDSQKEGDEAYGDFFVWRELLDKAQEVQRPIVFVTRDVKEDWMQKVGGRSIGPRPELVAEMFAEANVRFHLYETSRFMQYAREFFNQQVSEASIEEVRDLPAVASETEEGVLTEPQQRETVPQSPFDISRTGSIYALYKRNALSGFSNPYEAFVKRSIKSQQLQLDRFNSAHYEAVRKAYASFIENAPLQELVESILNANRFTHVGELIAARDSLWSGIIGSSAQQALLAAIEADTSEASRLNSQVQTEEAESGAESETSITTDSESSIEPT